MYVIETLKRALERATGVGKASARSARQAVRPRKPHRTHFEDDGVVPNHPALPLVVYRSPVKLEDGEDTASVFEELFERNGWTGSWRNGIYDYVHYHPRTHEVLGIARGRARVRFGGNNGKIIEVRAGDVVVLPAGTGHQRLSASKDLLVVGAYPPDGKYEEYTGKEGQHPRAVRWIPDVPMPRKDPLYGKDGPLIRTWRGSMPRRVGGARGTRK